ncbi:MAG: HAMP domain-containing histidine kinase [Oscillospiraceae bacterium]|jgi:signal transduction histidine kinase|nr:HAMP domain-containing histidine kinase [Oscillospiraceae bacterium]
MRLFAKYFLCAALVISVALLFSGYRLITYSYENAVRRETERAVRQYQYDKFTVQAALIPKPDDLMETLRGLAPDLSVSGLSAFFAEDRSLLYSNLPAEPDTAILDGVRADAVINRIQTVDGRSYIFVCGQITQSGVTVYMAAATDMSSVTGQKDEMVRGFVSVYFTTLGISAAVILILCEFLTRPVMRINRAAKRIARGRYNERLPVSRGDEIGELAGSFNMMAEAVEEKITALSENARQKEDFTANFAHELKTPLTSIIGYADMLYQKALPPEQVRDAAWYILNEGLRLEALSLKLMDLIVLNRQDFVLEEMPAEELLADIAGGLKPVLEERKVGLRVAAGPAYIKADYDLIKTLLLNLIDNALKAGCNQIEIEGKVSGGRYCVSIADNGRGIPASELTRITEAFYMVDKSRSRKQHGAGLGLALAARIAEIHGGALEFASREGVGTVVKISFICAAGGDEDE